MSSKIPCARRWSISAKTGWSSARAHVSDDPSPLLDLVSWRERHTAESWKRVLDLGLHDAALADRIREATLTGRPLGSDEFLDRIEGELGRPARRLRPGPKPKPPTALIAATSTQLTLPSLSA